MNPRDLTHEQIWSAIQDIYKRLVSLEMKVRNIVENSVSWSGSASSGATSLTGGFGSISGSFSADLEASISGGAANTSGTGSAAFTPPRKGG